MRRLTLLVCLALPASVVLAPVPAADAAKKKAVKAVPAVKQVSPMRVKVGRTISVRGRNFSSSKRHNTVIFRGAGGRSVLVKPKRATRRKLVVAVSTKVQRILKVSGGRAAPTRVRLTVLSKPSKRARRQQASRRTGTRQSPMVVPLACGKGSDWDGDLLSNDLEMRYGLDPCKADSDGDAAGDGWEYWSAKDLNVKAVPYPGKKPYPNPLQADDAQYDFDGDRLVAGMEFKLWKTTGSFFDPSRANNGLRDSPLGYSDGTQTSRPGEVPATPAFKGFPVLASAYPGRLVRRDDGGWSDDERDADSDGLSNYVENTGPDMGPGQQSWWASLGIPPWPNPYYGPFTRRPFADTDATDSDVDGDTLLDAEDDQDNDDVQNFYEMYDPTDPYSNGQRKNAFNPCAPDQGSRTCPR